MILIQIWNRTKWVFWALLDKLKIPLELRLLVRPGELILMRTKLTRQNNSSTTKWIRLIQQNHRRKQTSKHTKTNNGSDKLEMTDTGIGMFCSVYRTSTSSCIRRSSSVNLLSFLLLLHGARRLPRHICRPGKKGRHCLYSISQYFLRIHHHSYD